MKRLLAISIAYASFAIGAIPALAEVDAKTHKLCLEAKDYLGCVKAMTGEIVPAEQTSSGNKCQIQFAYIGNGNCQRVGCRYGWWATGSGNHNAIVAGKSEWKCPRQFRNGVFLTGSLILEEVAPIGFDSKCPPVEPDIGWNSSCETAPDNWKELEEAKKPRCNFKLEKYGCSFDAYLEANPAMKKWAELNPEMATKERIKLQSID